MASHTCDTVGGGGQRGLAPSESARVARLDPVKVAPTEGHKEAADKLRTDYVINRTDEYLASIDLLERKGDVASNQGWGNSMRRPTT